MTAMFVLLYLLAWHWYADFVLQTEWQAHNKSKSNVALGRHVGVYTAAIGVAAIFPFWALGTAEGWLSFVAVNGVLHFATDYVTSRVTSRLYNLGRERGFFMMIGFDQLIHQTCLAVTLWEFMR